MIHSPAAKPIEGTALLSIALFALTIPVYFAVNLDENVVVVGAYSASLFLMVMGLALYAGVMAGRIRIIVSVYLYLIMLVAFQFSVVGLFSQRFHPPREPVTALFSVKTLLAFGIGSALLVFGLRKVAWRKIRGRLPSFDKAMWLFLFYCLASFVLSRASIEPRVAYLTHSVGTLAVTWLAFRYYRIGERELAEFGKLVSGLCAVLIIAGLVTYNFQETIWLKYLKVQVAHAGMGSFIEGDHLPPWFSTALGIGEMQYSLPRLVSLVGNPVTFGYLLCFSYIFSLYMGRRRLAAFFLMGTALALSKGAIMLALVTTFYYFVPIRRKGLLYLCDVLVMLFVTGLTYVVWSAAVARYEVFLNVLYKQASTLVLTSLVGFGLGSGGTLAAQAGYVEGTAEATGGESALGSMLFQIGFIGTALYVAFFFLLRHWITTRLESENKPLYRLAQGCATAWLLNSVFQESLISLTVYLPYLFFFAAAANTVDSMETEAAVS